jgi:hypothetical protein
MISANVEVSGRVVDVEKPGVYNLTYNCADSSGYDADPQTRSVVVVCSSGSELDAAGSLCTECATGKWTEGRRAFTECVSVPTPYPTPYPKVKPPSTTAPIAQSAV